MKRQPRNPLRDKLVNERLISIAYGQIGTFSTFTLSQHCELCLKRHMNTAQSDKKLQKWQK